MVQQLLALFTLSLYLLGCSRGSSLQPSPAVSGAPPTQQQQLPVPGSNGGTDNSGSSSVQVTPTPSPTPTPPVTVGVTPLQIAQVYNGIQNAGGNYSLNAAGLAAASGTFTSQLFFLSNPQALSAIGWSPSRPMGKELLSGKQVETGYGLGGLNMSANEVLLHLNEAADATSFADVSGENNNGSCNKLCVIEDFCGRCPGSAPGKFHSAATFHSEVIGPVGARVTHGTYIDLGTQAAVTGTGGISISAWVKLTTLGQDQVIIQQRQAGADEVNFNGEYMFRILAANPQRGDAVSNFSSGGCVNFAVYNNENFDTNVNRGYGFNFCAVPAVPLQVNRWYHLLAVRESDGRGRIYIDGVQRASELRTVGGMSSIITLRNLNVYVGGDLREEPPTDFLQGAIDELAVFSKSLNSTEASDLYQRGVLHAGFQVKTCGGLDGAGCLSTPFVGHNGTDNTYITELNSTNPLGYPIFSVGFLPNFYYQFKLFLWTDDPTLNPTISNNLNFTLQ